MSSGAERLVDPANNIGYLTPENGAGVWEKEKTAK